MKVNTTLTGVVTQGRPSTNQWVTRYKISFRNFPDELEFIQDDDGNDMVSIMTSLCKVDLIGFPLSFHITFIVLQIFEGNTDKDSHVLNIFPQPITARYVRFVVWNFKSHISMRIEYVTC